MFSFYYPGIGLRLQCGSGIRGSAQAVTAAEVTVLLPNNKGPSNKEQPKGSVDWLGLTGPIIKSQFRL